MVDVVHSTSNLRPRRRFHWSLLRPTKSCYSILLLCISFVAACVLLQRNCSTQLNLLQPARLSVRRNDTLSYETLQRCVDDYTSRGFWDGSTWRVDNHPSICQFQAYTDDDELAAAFRHVNVGFLGDSTTRSDLRAWEETFQCERTNLDEAQVFQLKDVNGSYICEAWEQSMNLTKCGVPPIIEVTNCPRGISFRYFYKIYPWAPLDRWYLSKRDHLFRDLDVLVISLGRWFVYYEPRDEFNIAEQLDTFLVELKKVLSGTILYQSEYSEHLSKSDNITYPVPCTPHATCNDCGETDTWECSQTDETERPQSDEIIRAALEQHHILHLDRWNVSIALPLEYFEPWYCHNETIHQWDCSHHLGFVALQHMRLIANVIKNLFVSKQR